MSGEEPTAQKTPMVAFGCALCVGGATTPAPSATSSSFLRGERPVARRPRPSACRSPAATSTRGTNLGAPSMCAGHVRPSEGSLLTYMTELRPRIDYLEPSARHSVLAALEVASVAHFGQMRKSGEPFIIHPIAVAAILAEMRMDRDSVVAGLLHDTVEDTEMTLEEVEHLFGVDVRKIVEGETKFSKLAEKVHKDAAAASKDAESAKKRAKGAGAGASGVAAPPNSVGGLVYAKERDQAKREANMQKQADNLRAMFLAMTEDVRVIIVKLADRLHNLRTLQHMPPAKQKKIARETLEFLAPLSHRLGMRRIKNELEELSFRYLHPEDYRNIRNEVESLKRRSRFAHSIASAEGIVRDVLENDAILGGMTRSVEVKGSTKELYSIYKRTLRGETVSSMLDIATLTVVVDIDESIKQSLACYHVLGRLHEMWTPLPKRLKDYIAFPKPNGYQSLHTTVLLDQSHGFLALEIQIRTAAMHRIAEEGIVAELFQSTPGDGREALSPALLSASNTEDADTGEESGAEDGAFRRTGSSKSFESSSSSSSYLSSLSSSSSGAKRGDDEWRRRTKGWLISIREYIEEFTSSRDLVDAVRRDLLGNRVFVFTPGRNIVDLIRGSTPVDLAYAIHSDVGHQMIGAKVNGRMVRLDHKLQNADVVKIITSDSAAGPAEEWASYAKSRTARQKIRQFLRAREREEMIDRGRDKLIDAACKHAEPEPEDEDLEAIMPKLRVVLSAVSGLGHIRTVEDLLIAVARGVTGEGNLSLEETALTLLVGRREAVLEANGVASVAPSSSVYSLEETEAADFVSSTSGEESDLEDVENALQLEEYGVLNGPDDAAGLLAEDEADDENAEDEEVSHVELAPCCSPLCGDEVMGIRMGSETGGVVVHRLECNHMLSILREKPVNPKVVGVRWGSGGLQWDESTRPGSVTATPRMFLENGPGSTKWNSTVQNGRPCQPGRIAITARDCDGLLSYVTGIVAGLGKSIRRSCTDTDPSTLIATLAFEVLVENTTELRRILDRLKECDEVMSVRRVGANEGADFFPPMQRSRSERRSSETVGQATMIEIVDDDKMMIDAIAGSRQVTGNDKSPAVIYGEHVEDEQYAPSMAGRRLSGDTGEIDPTEQESTP